MYQKDINSICFPIKVVVYQKGHTQYLFTIKVVYQKKIFTASALVFFRLSVNDDVSSLQKWSVSFGRVKSSDSNSDSRCICCQIRSSDEVNMLGEVRWGS